MTTMFYNSLITIAKCYRTIVNTGMNIITMFNDDLIQPSKIDLRKTMASFEKMQACAQRHDRLEELYKDILEAYVSNFYGTKNHDHNQVTLIINIPKKYNINVDKEIKINYMKSFFIKKQIELLKTDKYKDLEIDYEFDCAINALADISTFTMDTYKEMYELRLKYDKYDQFRKKIITEVELVEKYILSINWSCECNQFNIDMKLLHNFESITDLFSSDADFYKMQISYDFHNNDRILAAYNLKVMYKKTMDMLTNTLPVYYNERKIKKQQFIEYENIENYIEFCESKNIKYKYNMRIGFKIAFNAIACYRGKKTSIDFFAKLLYYKNDIEFKDGFRFSWLQYNLIDNLEFFSNFDNMEPNKLDPLCMHTNYGILCMLMLSVLQIGNIYDLNTFSEQYVNFLMFCVKEKYKIFIAKFFDNLIRVNQIQADAYNKELINAKQFCIDIVDAIKSPVQITTKMNTVSKFMNYSEINFFQYYVEQYKPIHDKIKIYSQNDRISTKCIANIRAKTRNMLEKHTIENNFFEEMYKILILQKSIEDKFNKLMKNTNKDLKEFFDRYTNADRFYRLHALVGYMSRFTQQTTDIPSKLELFAFKRIVQCKMFSDFIKKNKTIIIDIIDDTHKLKMMIIKAEHDGSILATSIKEYYNLNILEYE